MNNNNVVNYELYNTGRFQLTMFYAPEGGHIVIALSVCLSVCLKFCHTLRLGFAFRF